MNKDKIIIKKSRFTYLINENDKTAWVIKGNIRCAKRYRVPDSVEIDGTSYKITSLEVSCLHAPRLRKLVISDYVTHMDYDLILGLRNLRSIYIGKGLSSINQFCFNQPLGRNPVVTIDKENPYIKIQENLILNKDNSKVLASLYGKHYYKVPDGVSILTPLCFSDKHLEYIELPDSLEEIGAEAFAWSDKLTAVFLPDHVHSIGHQAFYDCSALLRINIPDSIEKLGFEFLYGCINLKEIEIGDIHSDHIINIQENVIRGIPIDSCHLIVPHQLLEQYRNHSVWGKFKKIVAMNEFL